MSGDKLLFAFLENVFELQLIIFLPPYVLTWLREIWVDSSSALCSTELRGNFVATYGITVLYSRTHLL